MDQRGEITDDDRRARRRALGPARGRRLRHLDVLRRPAAAARRRHVRVCTGTACFAATGDAHVDAIRDALGAELGERSADGVGLARRDRLPRLLPRRRPAVRDGDVDRRRARASSSACSARTTATPPSRPSAQRSSTSRCSPAAATGRACAARWRADPRGAAPGGRGAHVRGRGGAGFPAGQEVGVRRAAPSGATSSSSPTATRATRAPTSTSSSWRTTRSCSSRASRSPATPSAPSHGFVLVRSEYPLSKPALDAAIARAHARGPARRRHPRLRVLLRHHHRRGRRLLRRRRGDGPAELPAGPARHGLRPPAVPRPARRARHADRRQQRRDALQHRRSSPPTAPTRTRALSPGARRPAPSSSASTSASPSPASTRSRSA